MANQQFQVGDTTYEFPESFSDDKVQGILSQQGIIKTPPAKTPAPPPDKRLPFGKWGEGPHKSLAETVGQDTAVGKAVTKTSKFLEGASKYVPDTDAVVGLGVPLPYAGAVDATPSVGQFMRRATAVVGAVGTGAGVDKMAGALGAPWWLREGLATAAALKVGHSISPEMGGILEQKAKGGLKNLVQGWLGVAPKEDEALSFFKERYGKEAVSAEDKLKARAEAAAFKNKIAEQFNPSPAKVPTIKGSSRFDEPKSPAASPPPIKGASRFDTPKGPASSPPPIRASSRFDKPEPTVAQPPPVKASSRFSDKTQAATPPPIKDSSRFKGAKVEPVQPPAVKPSARFAESDTPTAEPPPLKSASRFSATPSSEPAPTPDKTSRAVRATPEQQQQSDDIRNLKRHASGYSLAQQAQKDGVTSKDLLKLNPAQRDEFMKTIGLKSSDKDAAWRIFVGHLQNLEKTAK